MAEKQNIPEIRFEGFTDPWEQRKLGNCGTTYGGLTGKTKEDFGHGNARFIPYTNVFDNPLTDTKRLEAVEIDSSQNQVAYGDAFFTVSSETADEVGMSSVWLSDQEDVYLNSFCFGYRQDSTFDPHYLAYMLRSRSVRSNLTLLAQGISRFNISKNKVMELSVPVPSAVEQKQLGQYFTKLDSLITLQQRKCQYRSLYGYLSWEQRKLGELLLERNEQAPQSDKYPLMAFIANQGITPKGDRYDRSALVNDIEGKLYKRTEKGDFIYSSNNLETGSIGLNKYGNACISPVYSIFQPSGIADSDFLGRRLVRKDFIQEMVKWRQGVIYGQWRIHEADFLRLNIAVPSVDEQRLIGKLLDNLDALITLHQRQSNGKAHNVIILSRTKNRQLDIAKSAVLGLETRSNSRKLLNEHPIQQRFLDIP